MAQANLLQNLSTACQLKHLEYKSPVQQNKKKPQITSGIF